MTLVLEYLGIATVIAICGHVSSTVTCSTRAAKPIAPSSFVAVDARHLIGTRPEALFTRNMVAGLPEGISGRHGRRLAVAGPSE
jgi:hypothetical protein